MVVAKKFILRKAFEGEPKVTDLCLLEEILKPVKDGEILVEAEYISVDPYMRPFGSQLAIGTTMVGIQVANIVESKHSKWPIGQKVVAFIGWRTHTVFDPEISQGYGMIKHRTYLLPNIGDLSPSLALGVLGLPGNSAFFGFLEICKPKAGETVVISSAAGAIGSHVGQIAIIHGLRVIGITDSDIKCKWLLDELCFNHAINYKTENVYNALKKAAPVGVDCYFDNVGGEISSAVIHQMNDNGRISVCGSISSYNYGNIWKHDDLPKAAVVQPAFTFHQLKMEGFFVTRWADRWFEGIEKNLSWIRSGKLKYKETVTEGFDNMFQAFTGMLKGENIGKAIVKI